MRQIHKLLDQGCRSLVAAVRITAIGLAAGLFSAAAVRLAQADEPVAHFSGNEENLSSIYQPAAEAEPKPAEPMRLSIGPHLLIDDRLIAASRRIARQINRPRRDPAIPNPLIKGGEQDGCAAPYLTVLRDDETGRFRIWYNRHVEPNGPAVGFATMTSDDGVHWNRPHRSLNHPGPLQYGCSLVDRGTGAAQPSERYQLAWWANGGMMLALSPDAEQWTLLADSPVIRHNHDINSLYYDPIRRRHVATVSVYTVGPTWAGQRRVTLQSTSEDLRHWAKPWYVLTPVDTQDEGQTQFYAMDGYLARGELLIGMVKVLRDDLRAANTPDGSFGIGYTTLAWSRDGRHWVRDREPFFEPDPAGGAWDHAHAWIDEQVPVGDEVWLYYGGYQNGHKVNRTIERQIGLVRMPRDRYVARTADADGGTLRTVPVVVQGDRLTLNADVGGSLTARVLDAAGAVLPGFDYADCQPIAGDSLEHPLRWKGDLKQLNGAPVQLEFQLRDARLFAIHVEGS